jgi:hypothetical protein
LRKKNAFSSSAETTTDSNGGTEEKYSYSGDGCTGEWCRDCNAAGLGAVVCGAVSAVVAIIVFGISLRDFLQTTGGCQCVYPLKETNYDPYDRLSHVLYYHCITNRKINMSDSKVGTTQLSDYNRIPTMMYFSIFQVILSFQNDEFEFNF